MRAYVERLKSQSQYRKKTAFPKGMGEMKLIERKSKQEDRGQGKTLRVQSQENKTGTEESKIKNNYCEE